MDASDDHHGEDHTEQSARIGVHPELDGHEAAYHRREWQREERGTDRPRQTP